MRFEEAGEEMIEEGISDGGENHSLVMTHTHTNGRSVTGSKEVDGFDESEWCPSASASVRIERLKRFFGKEWKGECDRICRNNRTIVCGWREGECGESEGLVAIASASIEFGVTGFGESPDRKSLFFCKADIHTDCRSDTPPDKRVRMLFEEKGRHQVLKERSRPRDKRRSFGEREDGSIQFVPSAKGECSFGKCEKARDARFRGKRLIEAVFNAFRRDVKADRDESALSGF